MEWPADALAEIRRHLRQSIRPGLKKRLWAAVHADLVPAAVCNIARQHAHNLALEYDRVPLLRPDNEVNLAPALKLFAFELWVLHHAYGLPAGTASWWGISSDDLPKTVLRCDADGLPVNSWERHEACWVLERAWKCVDWSWQHEVRSDHESDDEEEFEDEGEEESGESEEESEGESGERAEESEVDGESEGVEGP